MAENLKKTLYNFDGKQFLSLTDQTNERSFSFGIRVTLTILEPSNIFLYTFIVKKKLDPSVEPKAC